MEAPLKDWEAGSHRQQSASTAASSTQTHSLHSRIYSFPDSQCRRDSRHYFSWYPVNISWVLRLKQIFLSSSSALFIILIKKNTPGVVCSGFSPATCMEICFQHVKAVGRAKGYHSSSCVQSSLHDSLTLTEVCKMACMTDPVTWGGKEWYLSTYPSCIHFFNCLSN